jgi:hypothetical protein
MCTCVSWTTFGELHGAQFFSRNDIRSDGLGISCRIWDSHKTFRMCVRRTISFRAVNMWLRFSHRIGILDMQFRCVTAFRMDCRSTLRVGRIYGTDRVPNTYVVRLENSHAGNFVVCSFLCTIYTFSLDFMVMWLNPYCRLFLSSLPVWDHHVVCVHVCVSLAL